MLELTAGVCLFPLCISVTARVPRCSLCTSSFNVCCTSICSSCSTICCTIAALSATPLAASHAALSDALCAASSCCYICCSSCCATCCTMLLILNAASKRPRLLLLLFHTSHQLLHVYTFKTPLSLCSHCSYELGTGTMSLADVFACEASLTRLHSQNTPLLLFALQL